MHLKKEKTLAMPERRQPEAISSSWFLDRECQGTLRLRHLLAQDGCKESQLALAKSLLSEPANNLKERKLNTELAVYWLLQAAKKGQQDAIQLLKECATSGIGLNSENTIEIEKCLHFSEEEIISRRVTFCIFRSIMSDTEESISEDHFRQKVDRILLLDNNDEHPEMQKLNDQTLCDEKTEDTSLRSQPHVSFSEVVNSVQSCLEGNMPLVSLKQVVQNQEYKKWLSTKYVYLIWQMILRSIEDLIQHLSSLVFVVTIFLLFILFKFASLILAVGSEIQVLFDKHKLLPITILCLFNLLSSTCFVIYIRFGNDNVKKWLDLIKIFEPNVKSVEVEHKYLSKARIPLLTFLLTSLMYIILLPLSSIQFAFSELGALSILLMVLVDRTITHQRYYINVSLILNLLACLYKGNILQKLTLGSLDFLNFNILYQLGNFEISINFITCVTLPFVLPYFYLKMAFSEERKGWHLVLLPHLMSITWMNLAFIHFSNGISSDVSILFFWVMALLISRYFGVILTLTLYIFLKAFYFTNNITFEVASLLLLIFLVCYFASYLIVKKFSLSNENKLCAIAVCLTIMTLSYQTYIPVSSKALNASDVLPWDIYQTHCYHHSWYRTNTAEIQIKCLPLKDKALTMEGTITSIEMVKVNNPLDKIVSLLPYPFHDWFACMVGKKYIDCNAENLSPSEKQSCLFYNAFNLKNCHYHNWDEYKFHIILEISTRTSPEVLLIADHVYTTFIRNLKEGDSLKVIGMLEDNIGGSSPKFRLLQATCTSCYPEISCNSSTEVLALDYSLSIKNFVFFYFSPLIQYVQKNNS